ncbi:MAG: RusA family crossover junction endodeoxyribonuclease [Coprobacillus cateniformis]|nr:RusA family crossover junction endodeoxyribonuclease [Coprobacillus cateniformis]
MTQWPKSGLVFEVPGKVRGKGRPRFMRNRHTYTDSKTVEYERLIKASYLKHTNYVSQNSIRMSMYVCFAPNKTDTKKNKVLKLLNKLWPSKKPDVDNVIKVVLDALNKVAYSDDTQVNEINVIRHWSEEDKLVICLSENGELFKR